MINVAAQISSFKVHPLGFYYCVIQSDSTTRRLHVYTDFANHAADNQWHTHEFDLKSKVLFGKICNHIGRFLPSTDGTITEFRVNYENSSSKIMPTGLSGMMEERLKFECSAGSRYEITAGEIHRVSAFSSPTVTLVEFLHRHLPIFSYGVPEQAFLRRTVNKAETEEIARILATVRDDEYCVNVL